MPSLATNRNKIVATAVAHLTSNDPRLGELIRRVGPFSLKLEKDRFSMLVRSILSQQISTKAAQSVRGKLQGLTHDGKLSVDSLSRLSDVELRSAGLSGQKTAYIRDLTACVQEGRLKLDGVHRLDDEAVIAELIQVKGIGVWTAQMFLMFSLGRLDVFPSGDLGLRSAMHQLYELPEAPTPSECVKLAEPWRPYSTVASWYVWRLADMKSNPQMDASQFPV